VRTRTRYVAVLKALVRRDGLRLTAGEAERTAAKFAVLDATGAVSDELRAEVAPLLAVLAPLNAEIAAADQRLTALAATDAAVQRLTTAPGIGRTGGRDRIGRDARRREPLPRCAPGRGLPRPRAERAELGRAAAPRPHHQGRESARALAPLASGRRPGGRNRLTDARRGDAGD